MPQLEAPSHLCCEYHHQPLGLDEPSPRFAWRISDARRGAVQSAYQVLVASSLQHLTADEADLWDSGKVDSAEQSHIVYAGPAITASTRYHWKVRTWDAQGNPSPWSEPTWWETGLLTRDNWQAQWIGSTLVGGPDTAVPCPFLRRSFTLNKTPRAARLYITAIGLYEAQINGQIIGDGVLTPGWTDFHTRVHYQTYDVTKLLNPGDNAIGAILGDGWACGRVAWRQRQNYYERPRLLAQLHVTFDDGSTEVIVSDQAWKTSSGPILASDLLMGETHDARLEMPGWSAPGFEDANWAPATRFDDPGIEIHPSPAAPVRRVMTRKPVVPPSRNKEQNPTRLIYNIGQNLAGRVRLTLRGERGATVKIRHGEMLQADGSLYADNLRSAAATDIYTLKGEGEETFEPRFTFHGFQYVELSSSKPLDPHAIDLTAIVLQSDTPDAGTFECSDPLINQLQNNIQWGQRGNFLEVPTDCPQRDERLGWTGDAQVFIRTACFNMDVAGFFTKWTQDLRDAQLDSGTYPCVAPENGFAGDDGGPAWSEAGIICPWTIYLCYRDTRILDRHYGSMTRFMDFLENSSQDLIRAVPRPGVRAGFGDWLAIDAPNAGGAPTPRQLIGTAYFAYCADLMTRIAELLGHSEDAEKYRKLRQAIKAAFNDEFVSPRGLVGGDTQTSYLLALGFDLIDEDKKPGVVSHLISSFKKKGWHLSTGFVGTPLIAPVLSAVGRTDLAYRVLKQETYPGWLYTVKLGATTMWERWNSWTPETGFGDVGMNSFNHYAYGSIGQWLYATVAGIDIDPEDPAYHHILICPQPGGDLTWAKASLESPAGPIHTHWRITGDTFHLAVHIPPNTRASVHLPTTDPGNVSQAGKAVAEASDIAFSAADGGDVILQLGAGEYRFEVQNYLAPALGNHT